jgi:uncharacterized protein YaiI (UPF0178 family)
MLVDADACPVKKEIVQICSAAAVPVYFVSSYAHVVSEAKQEHYVTYVHVDQAPQAADMVLLQMAQSGDIAVTQDYGLAALLLPKGCTVLHHRGFLYTEDHIDTMLYQRYDAAKRRRAGQKTKGPKGMTSADRERFRAALSSVLENRSPTSGPQ